MNKKILKGSIVVFLLLMLSRLTGFLRDLLLAYFYGVSAVTDSYIVVTSMYALFFSAISASVTVSYIQKLSSTSEETCKHRVSSKLILYVGCFVLVVSIVICIFPDFILKIFAYGFSNETKALTVTMMYVIIPFSFLTSIQYILNAYLHVKRVFWVGAFVLTISNICVILATSFSFQNYYILLVGNIAGCILSLIFTVFFAQAKGFKFSLQGNYKKELKVILFSSFFLFFGQLLQQLYVVIDKNFASSLGEGIITSISYANKLNTLFVSVFVLSLTTVLFPSLSESATHNREKFSFLTKRAFEVIILFSLPLTVIIVLLSDQIISILFLRGAFTYDNMLITSSLLKIYALGIPFLGLNELLTKQFYALGNMKVPVLLSGVSLIINILLNFLLIQHYKYIGLAISTTLSIFLLFIFLCFKYSKVYGNKLSKKQLLLYFKLIISTLIMFFSIYYCRYLFKNELNIISFIFLSFIGIIIYFVSLHVLGYKKMIQIIAKILNKEAIFD